MILHRENGYQPFWLYVVKRLIINPTTVHPIETVNKNLHIQSTKDLTGTVTNLVVRENTCKLY